MQRLPIKIFGHRGMRGSGNPPENSLAAFMAAIDQGAQGIELDLFLSKDKKLIVFHDETLKRMTGVEGNIVDKTLEELKGLRLLDTKNNSTDQKIPTYAEVLHMIEQERNKPGLSAEKRGRMVKFIVNTEIKGLGIASHVAEEIKAWLNKGWTKENFQVSSFDMESLREMKQSLPDVPRGVLLPDSRATGNALRQALDEIKDIEPDSINITLHSLMANAGEAAEIIRAAGYRPFAWTGGEQPPVAEGTATPQALQETKFLLEQGIDLITDYTGLRHVLFTELLETGLQ